MRGPRKQRAKACRKRSITVLIAHTGSCGEKLCIVIYFILNSCRDRVTLAIYHAHRNGGYRSVVSCYVYLGVTRCASHNLLGAVIVTKSLGVHQHTTRSRSVEPSKVEHGLGLAGTKKVPLTIYPSLHPSVVIVGVSPTRGIYLTSRDTHGTQSGDGEG